MCIMSDSTLHGDATVEDNINEGRDIGDGSESRVSPSEWPAKA